MWSMFGNSGKNGNKINRKEELMYKVSLILTNKATGLKKKVAEAYLKLYENITEFERINKYDHNIYNGHVIVNYICK